MCTKEIPRAFYLPTPICFHLIGKIHHTFYAGRSSQPRIIYSLDTRNVAALRLSVSIYIYPPSRRWCDSSPGFCKHQQYYSASLLQPSDETARPSFNAESSSNPPCFILSKLAKPLSRDRISQSVNCPLVSNFATSISSLPVLVSLVQPKCPRAPRPTLPFGRRCERAHIAVLNADAGRFGVFFHPIILTSAQNALLVGLDASTKSMLLRMSSWIIGRTFVSGYPA